MEGSRIRDLYPGVETQMGLVKRHIEDMTYAILTGCNIPVTDDNYDRVFTWVMDNAHLAQDEESLINHYREEHAHG